MSQIVWITGAHGFIGRHVALTTAQQGATVVGIGHGHWPLAASKRWAISEWINGDINSSNLQSLSLIAGCPDVVIHLAGGSSVGVAIAHPREDFFRTVVSSIELLEWLRINSPNTLLVVASSAAVYGAGHQGNIAESASLCPYSPYGQHKLMMESLCYSYAVSYGLRSVVARLFSVYGAGLQKQLLWDLCSQLDGAPSSIELGGTGAELRDWVDVRDIAQVLARLGSYASVSVPIFNVGSGVGTSVRNIAELLIDAWTNLGGIAPELKFNGRSREGDPFNLVADIGYLTSLGLNCLMPIKEGISAYADWFHGRKNDK